MKSLPKKYVLVIAVTGLILLAVAIVAFALRGSGAPGQPESKINIVGTWYSDKPDCVTFDKDGNFRFFAWNGGNPWLNFPGTYTVDAETVTLQNSLDGTFTLTIGVAEDGSYTLSGKNTYYQTEEAARAAIAAAEAKNAEEESNIVPNTVKKLVGEWTSWNGEVNCSITETTMTFHLLPNGDFGYEEEWDNYEYEIIDEKWLKLTRTKDGVLLNETYKLEETVEGLTLYSDAFPWARSFKKNSDQPTSSSTPEPTRSSTASSGSAAAEFDSSAPNVVNTRDVISVDMNPDFSAYTPELYAFVKENIIGTWSGTFDDIITPDTVYWVYTFNTDGTYSFSNGTRSESGTYTLTCDANDIDYRSTMQLSFEDGERTLRFNLSQSTPMKFKTDENPPQTYYLDNSSK